MLFSICIGTCNTGFKFPDQEETMELECSQLTGVWLPYRNFPDCIGELQKNLFRLFILLRHSFIKTEKN